MDGKFLQEKIKAAGVSQAALAKVFGVTPQTVSDRFKTKNVTSEMLEKISQVIQKPIDFLYEGYDDNKYVAEYPIKNITLPSEDSDLHALLVMLKEKDDEIKFLNERIYQLLTKGKIENPKNAAGQ